MYKVVKDRGGMANVTVQNMETMASVIIGKPTIEVLDILARDGYSPSAEDDDKVIDMYDEWNINVSDDVAKALTRTALKMKKPARKPAEAKSEQDAKTQESSKKQPVDVFNLIFGIKD